MAILKQIKFGTSTTPIAKTVVKGTGVVSVTNTEGFSNKETEEKDYSYDIDVNVDDSTIKKSDGKLTVGNVPAAQVTVADEAGVFTAGNVETALKELKDNIANVDGKAKSYTIVKETEGLEANVLEQYKLQQTVNGKTSIEGETIKIYKDRSLKSVALDGQTLNFTYILADGKESTVGVDVSTFLAESEFNDGLQVNGGVVSVKLGQGLKFGDEAEKKSINVKIDSTSESFLTVGEGGVKLAGVENAINTAVSTAVENLDVDDTAKDGEYVSQVSETNGKIAVVRANVSDAVLNGYTKGTNADAILATDSLKVALGKLEKQVDKAKAAATTKVVEGTDDGNNLSIASAKSDVDGSTTYTINLTDVASKTALDAEIAARKAVDGQSGDTYGANGNANYISDAISLNDADVKLDAALKAEETRAKSAEGEIASKVGLSDAEGSRTWTPTTNYGGSTTSVKDNMQALDTQLKNVTDKLSAVQYQVNGTTLEFFGISPKTV